MAFSNCPHPHVTVPRSRGHLGGRPAREDRRPIAFVTGCLRPSCVQTLGIRRIAVDEVHRGHRLAAARLDELTAWMSVRHPLTMVEVPVTPGFAESLALSAACAARHRADAEWTVLFRGGVSPRCRTRTGSAAPYRPLCPSADRPAPTAHWPDTPPHRRCTR